MSIDDWGRPRDRLLILDLAIQYDEQLAAIHSVLALHKKAAKEIEDERLSIEKAMNRLRGAAYYHAEDDWGANFYRSVYADASSSISALVMIAPFVEALFSQFYTALEKQPGAKALIGDHDRWQSDDERKWNCRFVVRNKRYYKGVVEGMAQVADMVGLMPYLSKDLFERLTALFAYRNKVFHHGIEWPMEERLAFQQRVAGWPEHWFAKAESDHKPWIYYLSDSFLTELIKLIERTLDDMGKFVDENKIGLVVVDWPFEEDHD